MSQTAVFTEGSTVEVAKQTAARLARVIDIFPACKSIHESTHLSGVFDTFEDAGIPVPDAAVVLSDGGAGNMSGTRAVYVVFRDSNRNAIGNPSAISNSLVITSKIISIDLTGITNEAANSRVTNIDIYVNLSTGGSVYYYAATITAATTSTTIDVTDATIQANDTLELDNDAPTTQTYGVAKAHKGRMFLVAAHDNNTSDYEDDFIYGKINSPDNFPLLNRVKVEPGRYGRLVTAEPAGDALIFYKERAIYELHYDQDPSGIFGDGFAKTVNTLRGTVNKRTVANVQGLHFVMDRIGIYAFSGGTAYRELATKLRHYWDRINWSRKEWFCAAVLPDRVVFTVALDGDNECNYMFVLDLNAWYAKSEANWYVSKTDHGIRDLCNWMIGPSARATDTRTEWTPSVALLTEYGFTGILAVGYRDGLDAQLTAQGTVTTGGSTTAFTDSASTMSRSNDAGDTVDVVGLYVRFLNPNADKPGSADWSQAYRITSLSGTTNPTFTPATPENIPVGTAYVIGAIPDCKLLSPVYGFDAPSRRKFAARVVIEHQPAGLNTSQANLSVSMDRRNTHLTRMTREKAQYTATDRDTGLDLKLGGGPVDGGRQGCHAEPAGDRGFANMQIVLTGKLAGGHSIDDFVVIDSLLVEGITPMGDEVP